jgi:KRAB domain-containing zinc finger protein
LKPGETIPTHKQSHRSEYRHQCPQCDDQRKFYSDIELTSHIKTKHLAVECGICNRNVQESRLDRHIAAYHGFQCSKCQKYFQTENQLNHHFERMHAVHFLNKCIVCGKRFEFPNELQDHLLIHNNGFIYDCPVCGECFKLEKKFSKHINYVHEKIFDCEVCQKTFGSLEILKEHKRTHPQQKVEQKTMFIRHVFKAEVDQTMGTELKVEKLDDDDDDIEMVEFKQEFL